MLGNIDLKVLFLVSLCDKNLLRASRMASVPPSPPTPTQSRFSLKQELMRKKSKSTFKLFSSLTSSNSSSNLQQQQQSSSSNVSLTSSPSQSSIARPRTTSTYSDYILGLEASNNSIYYSTTSSSNSSIKSQQSAESKLTLHSLASTNNNHDVILPHQSTLSRLAAESGTAINQPRYFSVSSMLLYT